MRWPTREFAFIFLLSCVFPVQIFLFIFFFSFDVWQLLNKIPTSLNWGFYLLCLCRLKFIKSVKYSLHSLRSSWQCLNNWFLIKFFPKGLYCLELGSNISILKSGSESTNRNRSATSYLSSTRPELRFNSRSRFSKRSQIPARASDRVPKS